MAVRLNKECENCAANRWHPTFVSRTGAPVWECGRCQATIPRQQEITESYPDDEYNTNHIASIPPEGIA